MASGMGAGSDTRSGRITQDDPRDQSVGELLKQLSQETSTLVKQELDLAKAEMTQKGKQAGTGAGMLGGGALFGLGAFGAFTAFLIALLATAIDHTWIAALIVALLYGAIAGVLALRGKKELTEMGAPVPEQTIETVKTTPEAIRR